MSPAVSTDPASIATIRERQRQQRLTGQRLGSPGEVVSWLGAMQAQEFAEAKWSIAERMTPGATDGAIEESFASGEILRTHVLRPTWHFVAPADIRWLLELTAPRVHSVNEYYARRSGLDADALRRTDGLIADALGDGEPRTRKELAGVLAASGVDPGNGVRLGLIVMHAELAALICSGPLRGKQHTYALLAERAPEARSLGRDEALAELALRYFRGHGPVTRKDLAAWSSLTLADVERGIELAGDLIVSTTDEGGTEWLTAAPQVSPLGPAAPLCLLTPTYDETIMGYRELRVVLAAAVPREGMLTRAIVIDRTVGSWKRVLARRDVRVEATLFTSLSRDELGTLQDAAERFGQFLGLPATLQVEDA